MHLPRLLDLLRGVVSTNETVNPARRSFLYEVVNAPSMELMAAKNLQYINRINIVLMVLVSSQCNKNM